jgi:hypothetical protein
MKSHLILISLLLYIGCDNSSDSGSEPVLSSKFSDIQKQTFNKSCANGGCHDAVKQSALLCLTQDSCYSQLMNHSIQASQGAAKNFTHLVVPGKPDSSFLIYKLTLSGFTVQYGDRMPYQSSLPQNQIDAIVKWINDGAKND